MLEFGYPYIYVIVIYRLSNIFETFDLYILLAMLCYYRVRGVAHKLLLKYLLYKYQYVDYYKDVLLASQHINTGVLQGYVLRPLLFLFYVNEELLVSSIFRRLMYSKDTTIFTSKIT